MEYGEGSIEAGIDAAERWPDVVQRSMADEFRMAREMLVQVGALPVPTSAPLPEGSMWADAEEQSEEIARQATDLHRHLTNSTTQHIANEARRLGVAVPKDILGHLERELGE